MATKQYQVNQLLLQFYDRPVAKVSLELVFSILMVIVFALFAIRPTLVTMGDLLKEIDDKQKLNDALAQKVAALSTVQTTYLALQDRLAVLDKALPSSPHFQEALAIMEKLASDRNLTITDMSVKEIPREVDESTVDIHTATRISRPMSVTVVGDYPSIRQFVEDIRNVQRTMVVNSIVFTVNDVRGQKQLRATITINLEYFGTEKGTAKTGVKNT